MDLNNLPILSILIWLPILGGIWALFIGDQQERMVRQFSLLISIVAFFVSVLLYYKLLSFTPVVCRPRCDVGRTQNVHDYM